MRAVCSSINTSGDNYIFKFENVAGKGYKQIPVSFSKAVDTVITWGYPAEVKKDEIIGQTFELEISGPPKYEVKSISIADNDTIGPLDSKPSKFEFPDDLFYEYPDYSICPFCNGEGIKTEINRTKLKSEKILCHEHPCLSNRITNERNAHFSKYFEGHQLRRTPTLEDLKIPHKIINNITCIHGIIVMSAEFKSLSRWIHALIILYKILNKMIRITNTELLKDERFSSKLLDMINRDVKTPEIIIFKDDNLPAMLCDYLDIRCSYKHKTFLVTTDHIPNMKSLIKNYPSHTIISG